MTFNELNTIEPYLIHKLTGIQLNPESNILRESPSKEYGYSWEYKSFEQLNRKTTDILVEDILREKLIELNPEIATNPERVDEVLYKLRAVIASVESDGLVKANEEFAFWLTGNKTMPFGENNQHTTVRLIDFDDISRNSYIVTNQYTVQGKLKSVQT